MASVPALVPSQAFREALRRRGGDTAARCFQCATCSAVCELAQPGAPFPRRQMLMAQWGLADELAADPAVWLCHQCNDCTARCPRDARPGDVLQTVRALAIERLAFPTWLGRAVAAARATWPLLFGLPLLFWIALLAGTGHLDVPSGLAPHWSYGDLVPHAFIYGVFFPVAAWVLLASATQGTRFWRLLGRHDARGSSLIRALPAVLAEIATHKRFASCETARPRRLGHLLLLWGFVGAAATSGLLIVAMYVQRLPMPLPLTHPYKLLGNLSAAVLVAGVVLLAVMRLAGRSVSGATTTFDAFFLTLVGLVIATGCVVELARLGGAPALGLAVYVVHLGVVMALFVSFPYSKFAHMLYRTLAMAHERIAVRDGNTPA
jgi:quinone-modifying oxidoreductase, subunit QmoC